MPVRPLLRHLAVSLRARGQPKCQDDQKYYYEQHSLPNSMHGRDGRDESVLDHTSKHRKRVP